MVDYTGSWALPFAGSVGLLVIGIVMTFFMRPVIPLDRNVNLSRTANGQDLKLADNQDH